MSAEEWYVQNDDRTVVGPMSERDVATELLSGKIAAPQRVRQGSSGDWCDAARARAIFQQLVEIGWYVRTGVETFGPFTSDKLINLHRAGDLAPEAEVRQGLDGSWKSARAILDQWQQQKAASPETSPDADKPDSVRKWSVEPIRHVLVRLERLPAAPKCEPLERLLLEYPQDWPNGRLRVTTRHGDVVGALREPDSLLVEANAARGVTHVVLSHDDPKSSAREVVLVMCPPGIEASTCQTYINEQFRPADR